MDKLQCPICGKVLSSRQTLKQHLAVHAELTLYKCEECGLGFRQTSNLYRHMCRAHRPVASYLCKECGKAFKSDQNLRAHIVVHDNVRKHRCNICKKTFSRKSDLNRHAGTHNSLNRRSCGVCQKTFSDVSCLKRHEKKHELETTQPLDEVETNFESQAFYDWLISYSEALRSIQPPLERRTYLKAAQVLNEVHVRLCTADGPVLSYRENYEALKNVASNISTVLRIHHDVVGSNLTNIATALT